MNDFEFIAYRATPEEHYHLGIVTVRAYGKIVLNYKIVDDKKGSFYVFPPNYRLGADASNVEYIEGFDIDSKVEDKQLKEFIREKVSQAMNGQSYQEPPQQTPQQQEQTHQAQSFQPDDNMPF